MCDFVTRLAINLWSCSDRSYLSFGTLWPWLSANLSRPLILPNDSNKLVIILTAKHQLFSSLQHSGLVYILATFASKKACKVRVWRWPIHVQSSSQAVHSLLLTTLITAFTDCLCFCVLCTFRFVKISHFPPDEQSRSQAGLSSSAQPAVLNLPRARPERTTRSAALQSSSSGGHSGGGGPAEAADLSSSSNNGGARLFVASSSHALSAPSVSSSRTGQAVTSTATPARHVSPPRKRQRKQPLANFESGPSSSSSVVSSSTSVQTRSSTSSIADSSFELTTSPASTSSQRTPEQTSSGGRRRRRSQRSSLQRESPDEPEEKRIMQPTLNNINTNSVNNGHTIDPPEETSHMNGNGAIVNGKSSTATIVGDGIQLKNRSDLETVRLIGQHLRNLGLKWVEFFVDLLFDFNFLFRS